MVSSYQGHYSYNKQSVQANALHSWGVYYCGHLIPGGNLVPDYIGRAAGQGVTINSRLSNHLNTDRWNEVTHFGFVTCSTSQEAENFEKVEIQRCNPKYNQIKY